MFHSLSIAAPILAVQRSYISKEEIKIRGRSQMTSSCWGRGEGGKPNDDTQNTNLILHVVGTMLYSLSIAA